MELSEALEIEKLVRQGSPAHRTEAELALIAVIDDLRGPGESTDVQAVIDAYHKHLPMLPKVSAISQPRKKKIIAQWKAAQKGKPAGARATLIDFWDHTFAYASRSDFLTGRRGNDRGWKPNIDFFLQASSLTKLREGAYHGTVDGGQQGKGYWI